jgi:hypothetical protein
VWYWSFLWKPQWRTVDMMCEIFKMGAHTLFVSLVMDKHRFVFSLYPSYLYFFNFVTILSAFCVNYLPPQIRNMCAPN